MAHCVVAYYSWACMSPWSLTGVLMGVFVCLPSLWSPFVWRDMDCHGLRWFVCVCATVHLTVLLWVMVCWLCTRWVVVVCHGCGMLCRGVASIVIMLCHWSSRVVQRFGMALRSLVLSSAFAMRGVLLGVCHGVCGACGCCIGRLCVCNGVLAAWAWPMLLCFVISGWFQGLS